MGVEAVKVGMEGGGGGDQNALRTEWQGVCVGLNGVDL